MFCYHMRRQQEAKLRKMGPDTFHEASTYKSKDSKDTDGSEYYGSD